MHPSATLLHSLLAAADLDPTLAEAVTFSGADPVFPLPFRVGEAGAAAIAAAALGATELWRLRTGRGQRVSVDVPAAAAAMRSSQYLLREPISASGLRNAHGLRSLSRGIFPTKDGRWLYLHRNSHLHRARQVALLQCEDSPESLAPAVAQWEGEALERAIHEAGAVAALARRPAEWLAHPQGQAIAGLPLFEITRIGDSPPEPPTVGDRPLSGLRVLDLTRVLAGPTCARTLAEHGAEALRISTTKLPNGDEELIDTGHGKRSAVLDLDDAAGREQLWSLIRGADVFSQGYRPGSLAARGFTPEAVAAVRPGIIYVTLSAFGHKGPWATRRGFDTVVQTVSGLADEFAESGRPRLLPVSALDYLTGYLTAFATLAALARRAHEGGSYLVRVSLAQTGHWFSSLDRVTADLSAISDDLPPDQIAALSRSSDTPFGRYRHLAPAAQLSETPPRWDRPAVPIDHDEPVWLG